MERLLFRLIITCNTFQCMKMPAALEQNDLLHYGSFLSYWFAPVVKACVHLTVEFYYI